MPKRAPANTSSQRTATKKTPDPLAESINRATAEIAILRHVLDEIREDFSWLLRNGLPVQPIEHTHVKRMALDPLADDWNEHLQIERFVVHPNTSASPLESQTIDHVADELKIAFEAVAQGQLEIVLTAIDGVRSEIMAALKHRPSEMEPPLNAPDIKPARPSGRLF